jgi:hypothetical protein
MMRSDGIVVNAGLISSAWKNFGLFPGPEAFGLFSSRSLDGGLNDRTVVWRSLLILDDRTVRPMLGPRIPKVLFSL